MIGGSFEASGCVTASASSSVNCGQGKQFEGTTMRTHFRNDYLE